MTINTIDDIFQNISVNGVSATTVTPSYTINTPTTGTNVTWANPNTWITGDSFTIASPHTSMNPSGKLQLKGKDADIEINGESLVAMLKRIEERINLLTVNAELEAEWDELRELGNQYRALEQRIKDKMETWSKLNAQDKDNR